MSNQDEEKQSLTQEQAQRAVEKLQAFYDSLPEDEKIVLESILSMAAGAEVTGHTEPVGPIRYQIISLPISLGIVRPSNEAWYVQSSADSSPAQGQADLLGGGGGAAGGAGSWRGF